MVCLPLVEFAQAPIATLEMHPIERRRDSAGGIALHASSPLAQQLSQLVTQTARSAPANVDLAASGEVLYRMVVPAKVASQMSKGLVKPMASKAISGGVYSALRDSTGIVSKRHSSLFLARARPPALRQLRASVSREPER